MIAFTGLPWKYKDSKKYAALKRFWSKSRISLFISLQPLFIYLRSLLERDSTSMSFANSMNSGNMNLTEIPSNQSITTFPTLALGRYSLVLFHFIFNYPFMFYG